MGNGNFEEKIKRVPPSARRVIIVKNFNDKKILWLKKAKKIRPETVTRFGSPSGKAHIQTSLLSILYRQSSICVPGCVPFDKLCKIKNAQSLYLCGFQRN